MMWMLAELYQVLPEVGDLPQPKLVFFLDEAHLLFKGASSAFIDQVIQTVRLIRSKGVGVFFITQSPKDIPADVLAQLGNRVQHALRAFTPDDAKAIKKAVATYPTTEYDLEKLLTSLGTGEAVVTVMNEKGAPSPVAYAAMRAPESSMEPAPEAEIDRIIASSQIADQYSTVVDRESAYEILKARAEGGQVGHGESDGSPAAVGTEQPGAGAAPAAKAKPAKEEPGLVEEIAGNSAVKSFFRSAGTVLGREITRSLFGTTRKRRR